MIPFKELSDSADSGLLDDLGQRVTFSRGDSIGAYLDWQGDRLGMVWSEPVDEIYEIFYRVWDANGNVLDPTVGLTRTGANSYIPTIVP